MKKTALLITVSMALAASTGFAEDAKVNWEKHCQKCHGADGKGQTVMGKKLKVKDYTDAKVQESFKDEEAIKITKEGKNEGDKNLMPKFADKLSDQEIKDLTAYVRKFKK